MHFIECIENKLGKKAEKNMMPMQKGDVVATYADIEALADYIGFKPETQIQAGINKFIDWYLDYYRVTL